MLTNAETIYLRLYPNAVRYIINGNSYLAKDMDAMSRCTSELPRKEVTVERLHSADYRTNAQVAGAKDIIGNADFSGLTGRN